MTRLLHIARYRHAMLDRKLALIAGTGEFEVSIVRPGPPRSLPAVSRGLGAFHHTTWFPPIRPASPHTAIYAALSFALPRLQPDVIHAEEEPDSVTALQIAIARRMFAPRARLILHTWQNVNRDKPWYVWRVLRAVLGQADGVLCASAEAIDLVRTFGFRGPAAEVPQYGVDLTTFHSEVAHRPSDALAIIYAGRLIPAKGLDTLIDAVNLVESPVRLLIIGDGPERGSLEARARSAQAGDRIHFLPRVSPQELAQRMADSDVLVLPSRTTPVWKEQFGRVLVEAMACAVPIVGSSSGAIAEVIGGGGLIFAEGNPGELADRLRQLARSPDLRRELGTRGRARVLERFSQERVAARTAEFYQTILAT